MIDMKILEEMLENFEKGTLKPSKNKLGDLKSKQILLYGAGNIGKRLYKNLKDNGIKITCFIDQNENLDSSNYEIPVYHPESVELEKYKESGYIILSVLSSLNIRNEIKNQLNDLRFKNVYALHEVNLGAIDNGAFYENLFNSTYDKKDVFGKDKAKIMEAFKLLEEYEDRELFSDYVRAHLTMDFTRFKDPINIDMQYLAYDISKKVDYSRFIDCGGYDGDTIRNLIEKGVGIKDLAVFEPQNDLMRKVVEYVRRNEEKFESVILFPCGVHSKTEKFKFLVSKDAPSAAKIHDKGNDIIQCVAIDDVLQGFNPTFIKMDIEGAEVEALKGAKNTITKYHPYLAICVYHSLSDIWEIPLLIKSFYQGYKFYLRSYNFMGIETVLYAFPER